MTFASRSLILALLCVLLASASVPAVAGAATPPSKLTLVLPLAARTAALQRFATAVATPGNPLYRRDRSIAWLSEHFGANRAGEAKVVAYLRSHGATAVRVDATGLFVDATLPTARAEALFSTRLIRHGSRADAYTAPASRVTIPSALAGTVTGVVGLDTRAVLTAPALTRGLAPAAGQSAFTSLSADITRTDLDPGSGYPKASGISSGCPQATKVGGFTPNEYLDAYGFNPLQVAGTEGQGERVALIEVDGFKRSDIATFAKCFGFHMPKILAFRANDAVTKSGLLPGGEATLDLELLDATAPDLSQIDVYESSSDIASALKSMTAPLQNHGYKPEVISASLGLCEPQVRQAIGLGGMSDLNAAFEEAGASGVSMLAASGDDGSADCVDSDSATAQPKPELAVNFPASSPSVTAVGGTNLRLNPANQIVSSEVWNDDQVAPGSSGGGGFSTVFKRPSYQVAVDPGTTRALPDVAMLADVGPGIDVYCSAEADCISPLPDQQDPWQSVGGTSAATPLLAGGLALIDQLLREHQQQNLGLVNPLLYAIGENPAVAPLVFTDVTLGSNDVGAFISGHKPLGCCTAEPGWDAASGWGGVNVAGLSTQALADSPAIVNVSETVIAQQRAVAKRVIYDTISCSGVCQIGAVATVTIGHAQPMKLYSGLYHLAAAGSKVVKIAVTPAVETKLQIGLERHLTITASVVGAIIDATGHVERQTPGDTVSITG